MSTQPPLRFNSELDFARREIRHAYCCVEHTEDAMCLMSMGIADLGSCNVKTTECFGSQKACVPS
jgi:hypothetical protein